MTETKKDIITEKMLTKSSRFEIIKPVNCDWDEFGKALRDLSWQSYRMANYLVTQLYVFDQYRNEQKRITGEYPKEILNGYQLLREAFPDVGTSLVTQTAQVVKKKYQSDRKAIFLNQKSLPTFRNMPICISNQVWTIEKSGENTFVIDTRLFPKGAERLRFSFIIKYKNTGHRQLLESLADGSYKQGMMQILKDKHGKWYAVLTFSFNKKRIESTREKTLEVDMHSEGIDLKISGSDYVNTVPIDDIKRTLYQFRSRQQQILDQKEIRGEGRHGHGRKALLKPQQNIQDKLANFKTTKNHNLSRYIVDYAVRRKCTCIAVGDKTFIPDWTIFDLCIKIKYKAEEAGLVYVEKPAGK